MQEYIQRHKIKNKVLNKGDIHKLASLLVSEHDTNPNVIDFSVNFVKGESVKSDKDAIFDIDQIEAKKVNSISMEYHSPSYANNITVEIETGMFIWGYIRIVIRSEDYSWYLRVRQLFEDKIGSIKNQKLTTKLLPNLLAVLFECAGLSYLLMYLTRLFLRPSTILSTQLINIITYMTGLFGYSIPILIGIANPSIEFTFGANTAPKWCEKVTVGVLGVLFLNIVLNVIISRVF